MANNQLKKITIWIEDFCRRALIDVERTNILYRVMREGCTINTEFGPIVLAGFSPAHVREMRRAMKKIPKDNSQALCVKYSYPLDPLGRLYTNAQLAHFFGITPNAFKNRLWRGKKELIKVLAS